MRKSLLALLTLLNIAVQAQNASDTVVYNPHDLFNPTFNLPAGNRFRSAKGIPGPEYWQNTASYLIHATFNEQDTSVTGDVTITYTNNSPDPLDYLWLQLDQNIFKPTSRAVAATKYPGDYFEILGGTSNGGYTITDVTITENQTTYRATPIVTDTRMQLRLDKPIQPKGGTASVKIKFHFNIPLDGAGRFGRQYTKNGVVYQIGQWYPRMCVYDEVEGWNTLPYMGLGEF